MYASKYNFRLNVVVKDRLELLEKVLIFFRLEIATKPKTFKLFEK